MTRAFFWLFLGAVLLGGTYVGVKLARGEEPFPGWPLTQTPAPPIESVDDGPAYVVCWGYIDGSKGWSKLFPEQVGRVLYVVPEFTYDKEAQKAVPTKVQKGDVLLKLDDEVARLKLAALGVTIDELTEGQRRYLTSWA